MANTFSFRLQVSQNGGGAYAARVVTSPLGDAGVSGVASPDPMQITALRSELSARPSEETEIALGTLLFDTLFTERVRDVFFRSLELARRQESGLRLSLDIQPYELSALPWELLFNPNDKQFMGRYAHNTVFRYVPRGLPLVPPTLKLPLHVLALFANPAVAGLPPLDVAQERAVMGKAVALLESIGAVHVTTLEHATIDQMVGALQTEPINIFYYQGHIGFDPRLHSSYLLMEGWKGEPMVKGVEPLSYTLRSSNVSLAIVNSEGMAAGTVAYDLVRRGFPTVVANQEPLNDDETEVFLRQFLLALTEGRAVDSAMTEARILMSHLTGSTARWASPMLVTQLAEPWLLTPEAQS